MLWLTRLAEIRLVAQAVLGTLAMTGIFVLACRVGSLAAYLGIVPVLLSLVLLDWRALATSLRDRGTQLFLLAFALLGIAFAITAKTGGDMGALVDFGVFPLYAAAAALFMRLASPLAGKMLAGFALTGAGVATAYGLYQVVGLHIERADGEFISIFFSDIGVFLGFLALGGTLLPGSRWRAVYALGPFLGIACAILGQTRTSFLAAIAMTIVFAIFAVQTWRGPALLRGALIAGGIIIAAGAGVAAFAPMRAFSGFEAIVQVLQSGRADESTNIRFDLYQAGFKAFTHSPFYGYGWYHRFEMAQPYMTNPNVLGFWPSLSHLHNDALNFSVGAGLLGLAAYICALAAPLVSVWRSPIDSQYRFRLYAALILTVGFAIMGLTDVMFVFELPKTVYCLAAAVIFGFCTDRPPQALRARR